MASANCISSIVVRTPSLQLGVLQSLRGSFQLVRSHLFTSLVHTSGGIQSEGTITSPSPSKAAQVEHKGVNPFTVVMLCPPTSLAYSPTRSPRPATHEDNDANNKNGGIGGAVCSAVPRCHCSSWVSRNLADIEDCAL